MSSLATLVRDLEKQSGKLQIQNLGLIDELSRTRGLMRELEAKYQGAVKERSRLQLKLNAANKKIEKLEQKVEDMGKIEVKNLQKVIEEATDGR